MNLTFLPFLIAAASLLCYSCQQLNPWHEGPAVVNLNDTAALVNDSIGSTPANLGKTWSDVSRKLPALKAPARLECNGIRDSVQFELSPEQREQLIPKELLKQKDPVVSALYNLVINGDTAGTFYHIYYPVVYDKLNDITSEIVLVLYAENGSYSDYKTLAIKEYGEGYSRIKSWSEILYLYSAERETIETDITVYDVSDNVSIRKVNSMHFSSRGSQEEYEKNNALIEKLMK